jgi:hypothetical protein
LAATKIRSTKSEIRNNIEFPKFQCSKQEFRHEKAQKGLKNGQKVLYLTTDFTDFADYVLASLVSLADFACKASFVANTCLRPPVSLRLPTYN